MQALRSERVTIRPVTKDGAAFILELGNDADWLRFIGDESLARQRLLSATWGKSHSRPIPDVGLWPI